MAYAIDLHSNTPPSRQLVDAVLDALARGELARGDRLPSVRSMAQQALINPNTVGKAYRDLEHQGVVLGRNGSGVFVTERGPAIARARRRGETLAAFARAARAAVRAGHRAERLRQVVEEACERDIA